MLYLLVFALVVHAHMQACGLNSQVALALSSDGNRQIDDSAYERNEHGIALARKGDLEGAIQEFQAAVHLNPDFAAAFYNLGTTYIKQSKLLGKSNDRAYYAGLDHAFYSLRRAAYLNPQSSPVHDALAWVQQETGDFPAALEEFRKAVAADPQSARAYENLGTALEHDHKFQQAIDAYTQAITLDPNLVLAQVNLSTLVQMHADKEVVLKERELGVREHAESAPAHTLLGDALYFTGDLKGAEGELRVALKLDPALVFPHVVLGRVLVAGGNTKEAVDEFTLARKAAPDLPYIRLELASALLHERETTLAIKETRSVIDQDPNNLAAHYLLARALKESGKPSEGSAEFRKTQSLESAKTSTEVAEAHTSNGIAALKAGNAAAAVQELEQAVSMKPDYPEANYYLGIALAQTRDWQPAVRAFETALQNRPTSAEIHYNFGITLWQMGRAAEAVTQFKATSQLNPDDGLARCALGKALLQQGHTQQGQDELNKAHVLGACN